MRKVVVHSFVQETQIEIHNLEDRGIEGWITLKQTFKKQDGGHGLD
jgi:hypothetical protein